MMADPLAVVTLAPLLFHFELRPHITSKRASVTCLTRTTVMQDIRKTPAMRTNLKKKCPISMQFQYPRQVIDVA